MSTFPDQAALSSGMELQVFDAKGQLVSFDSILPASGKTVVVFIRHFFCGICKAYVEDLARLPSDVLTQSGVQIVVIGCGQWQPIASYAQDTKFTGKIYADPSRKLYRSLGMTVENLSGTPSGETKRSYIKTSTLTNALQSIYKGPLSHPSLMGKQGNISQLGGDFIFGPNKELTFCSRMKHTEDHVEISELMKEAGITL
ncbi:AhpC/TSA antioxidant enzyme-domain-containing protein [Mucidula mucida]|nr:AhpC/TSA antioxidant enzyme-domain-containing protein [Mucidula mucida]